MRKTPFTVVSAVVAALVTGAVVARASIPDSTTGVITGCYNTKSGSLRVIDTQVGATCVRGEKQVYWNQTGPQGVEGPQGPQGPQGDPGATKTYVRMAQSELIPAFTGEFPPSRTVVAYCDSGDPLSGGGYDLQRQSGVQPMRVEWSRPDLARGMPPGWSVQATNLDPLYTAFAQAIVVCMDLPPYNLNP